MCRPLALPPTPILTEDPIVSPQDFVERYMTTEASTSTRWQMGGAYRGEAEGEEEEEEKAGDAQENTQTQRLETAIIHRRNSIIYTVDDGELEEEVRSGSGKMNDGENAQWVEIT